MSIACSSDLRLRGVKTHCFCNSTMCDDDDGWAALVALYFKHKALHNLEVSTQKTLTPTGTLLDPSFTAILRVAVW
jgi:hypothetical protein